MISLSAPAWKRATTVVALALVGTLVWTATSPAGSFQAPLAMTSVSKSVKVASDDESVRAEAHCPNGSIVTGGGVRVGRDEAVLVESSSPARGGGGWEARVALADADAERSTVVVTALCVKGSAGAISETVSARAR